MFHIRNKCYNPFAILQLFQNMDLVLCDVVSQAGNKMMVFQIYL